MEVETQVQIAQRLTFGSENLVSNILAETATLGRMLNGLKRSLKNKLPP